MSQHSYDHALESNRRFSSAGLPDDPNMEMELAREMAEAFPVYEPTDEELEAEYQRFLAGQRPADWYDVPCQGCGIALFVMPGDPPLCRQCQRGPTPPAGAAFPEVVSWPDEHLIAAIDLCERRDPGLNLHAVGNLPDRHEAFLHAVSAELVRRLDALQLGWAA